MGHCEKLGDGPGAGRQWEVPPPLWLVEREEEGKNEDEKKKKESENMEESLECSTTSPVLGPSESAEESLEITTASPLDESWLESVHTAKEEEELKALKAEESLEYKTNSPILDCGWGKGLSAPFPNASAPSTPMLLRVPNRGEDLSYLGEIGCVEKSPTG